MRLVLQRVTRAAVRVDGEEIASIGPGLVLLVGVGREEPPEASRWLAKKVSSLRIFPGPGGEFDRSVREVRGEVLAVSQFTLYAEARKGRRPGFDQAAPAEAAHAEYERFVQALRETGVPVHTGRFGREMAVELVNDGPVTLILER